MTEFPDDADGDVLRSLAARGLDLAKPRVVDFYCYAADEAAAHSIANRMSELGFKCDIHTDEDATDIAKRLSVYGALTMVPTYEGVTRIQKELNDALKDFGASCDGWGTLVDSSETQA